MKFLYILSTFPTIEADLPVHCLAEEVQGTWTLLLDKPSKERQACGHAHPDAEKSQPNTDEYLGSKPFKKIQVTLDAKHSAKVKDDAQRQNGLWTMIYDEGWEVRFGQERYFAFSRFDWVNNQNVTSCGETMVGWYNNDREQWGCYRAVKDFPKVPARKPDPKKLAFVQETENARRTQLQTTVPLDRSYHERMVDNINEGSESWYARVYDRWIGKSLEEMNKSAGIKRNRAGLNEKRSVEILIEKDSKETCEDTFTNRRPKKGDLLTNLLGANEKPPRPCTLKALAQTQTLDAEEEKKIEKDFPKEFSWVAEGYVEPVMDQADCGSCYIVSTTRMLTARHRIATQNKTAEAFSISFPLWCAEYNQGCQGGYAFLGSKWAHDVGLIPARCAPYTTHGKCHVSCDLSKEKRWRVGDYNYIGGWYGNSSVYAIMDELHKNGPMVVSFEPSDEFMYYAGGIYVSKPTKLNMGWQKVDHAVLLVGWGEEFDQKYWLVQNSWGTDWGEKGFFRIARGQNDSGIESIVVAATVVEETDKKVIPNFLGSDFSFGSIE